MSGATGPSAAPRAATAPRRGFDHAATPALQPSHARVNCSGVQVRSSLMIPPVLTHTHTHLVTQQRVHAMRARIIPETRL